MKKILPAIILFAALSCLYAFSARKSHSDEDLNECVKKYRAEWGRTCSACKQDGNTYSVFLRNECDQVVDVKCAVQEKEKRWRTFTHLSLAPKDSMIAYACNGAGKYLYWVRKTGDKSIEFPTDEEINTNYGK